MTTPTGVPIVPPTIVTPVSRLFDWINNVWFSLNVWETGFLISLVTVMTLVPYLVLRYIYKENSTGNLTSDDIGTLLIILGIALICCLGWNFIVLVFIALSPALIGTYFGITHGKKSHQKKLIVKNL